MAISSPTPFVTIILILYPVLSDFPKPGSAQDDSSFLPELTVLSVRNLLEPGFELKEGANHIFQFDITVEVDPSRTSAVIEGDELWQVSTWISESEDGSGRKMSFASDILPPEQSSQSYENDNGAVIAFTKIRDLLKAQGGVCEDFRFFCTRFDQPSNIVAGYNSSYTLNVDGDPDDVLTDCVPLGQCYGASANSFQWSLTPIERPAKGCARKVNVDIWVNFTENTRDLKGEGLWRLGIFGSSNADGFGSRYGEVRQAINEVQATTRLTDARPIMINEIMTDFELGSIGCISEFPYYCVEFAKGDSPNPDYTFVTESGDSSLIGCEARECKAGVAILDLNWSRDIGEFQSRQNASVSFDVQVTIDPCSPDVKGENLWKLSMFASENEDGSNRLQHPFISQILNPSEASTSFLGKETLTFTDVETPPFYAEILGCGKMKYLCLELSKGDLPNPDFEVIFPEERSGIRHCREEVCVGIYFFQT